MKIESKMMLLYSGIEKYRQNQAIALLKQQKLQRSSRNFIGTAMQHKHFDDSKNFKGAVKALYKQQYI